MKLTRRLRSSGALLALLTAGGLCSPQPAWALFGLFGENPPDPTPQTLPYALTIDTGDDKTLRRKLEDASLLYKLRQDAPPDGESLIRRAARDKGQLLDALAGEGFYDGRLEILIDGRPIPAGTDVPVAAVRAVETHRGRSVAPITVRVTPGRQYVLRTIRITGAKGETLSDVPARRLRLAPGDPARAADLRGAQARIIDYYRDQSRPLSRIEDIAATVDHATGVMDVVISVAPGQVAPIGQIAVGGNKDVPTQVIRSFIYAEPGDAYSQQAMADIRKSVLRISALSSARIKEAERLAPDGSLPVAVEVTERLPRLIGASARLSSLDGPAFRAYWEHRNLFGGAETLRVEGETFLPPPAKPGEKRSLKDMSIGDVGGRLKLAFMKPALWGSRNDLLIGAMAERDRTGGDRYGGYTSNLFEVGASIRHRFSDSFSMQAGLKFERGRTTDALGTVNYSLVGMPMSATYDSTDNMLDPTRGVRIQASVTPYHSLSQRLGFVESRASMSAYYSIDEDSRYILAGRIALGSIAGANITDIPANHRFYSGGAGSVRGYRNLSLGPLTPGGLLYGGRSLFEASVEARIKITDTFGIVPFFDAGGAFTSPYPDFAERVRYSAGLGFRYYTGIGPIRLDIATPLSRRKGDKPVALYISIGQAF